MPVRGATKKENRQYELIKASAKKSGKLIKASAKKSGK
jgi:hypothetical protein